MTTAVSIPARTHVHVVVKKVSMVQPLRWLGRGVSDLWYCGWSSIAHGFLIAVLGWMFILVLGSHPYFVAAAISGYLLVAPIMTTGLCELSRRRMAGEPVNFDGSLAALSRDGGELFRFGAVLAAFAVAWFALSEILLRAVLQSPLVDFSQSYWRGFFVLAGQREIISYIIVGGVLAVIVFTLSAISVPLIIDRHVGVRDAMSASLRVVMANIPAMLVWSAILVILTSIGFATLLFGMILVVPILGHGTWHAYRDTVR